MKSRIKDCLLIAGFVAATFAAIELVRILMWMAYYAGFKM